MYNLSSELEELNKLVNKQIKQILRNLDTEITANHRVIFKILIEGEITFAELAKYSRFSKSTLSEALTKYLKCGYITKRIDDNDNRIMYISLTEVGNAQYKYVDNEIKSLREALFKGITQQEKENMKQTIFKMVSNMEEL